MATMGREVYLLRFMLPRRSNGEKQIFNFSGLSLLHRSNSEELTRFRTAADNVFQNRPFLCNRMQQKMCCSLKHTRLIAICFLTLCALRDCRHVKSQHVKST